MKKNEHKAQLMVELSPVKLLFRFGFSVIIARLLGATYVMTDRIFIAQAVGASGLASMTAIFPTLLFIEAISALFSVGFSSIFSRAYGANNIELAQKAMASSYLVEMTVFSILLVSVLPNLDVLARWCGIEVGLVPLVYQYGVPIILSMALNGLYFLNVSYLRGIGLPMIALSCTVFSVTTNIVLDWLFVMVFDWGMAGAGWATFIANVLNLGYSSWQLWRRHNPFHVQSSDFLPKPSTLFEAVMIGVSPFLSVLFFTFFMLLFNRYAEGIAGSLGLATVGCFFGLDQFFYVPIFGLWDGMVGVVGYNFGAGRFDRVKKIVVTTIIAGLIYVCISEFCCQVFPQFIFKIFASKKSDPQLLSLGVISLRCGYLAVVFAPLAAAATYVLEGLGRWKESVSYNIGVMITTILILFVVNPDGWSALWLTMASFDLVKGLTACVVLWLIFRKLEGLRPSEEKIS